MNSRTLDNGSDHFQILYADAEPETGPRTTPLPLLDAYLSDQQDLSAVERFSQLHDRDVLPLQEPY